jgi:hypothetical protein
MAGPGSERIVIANWNARLASIMPLLLFVIASLGGIYDPVDRSHGGELWPGALFIAVAMMLGFRGLTVGVAVVGDKVISRGWFRTRTILRVDISSVRAVNYSGLWNRFSSSKLFLMLELNVAGREVEIPAVVGRPLKMKRLASQLRDAVGLAASSARVGEHRNPG